MYHIHGISISSNTTKTLFVAEELGIDYQYTNVDLAKGDHKTPAHLKRHPLGKLPTLTHDTYTLFESNAICAYLASAENSSLYPQHDYQIRAKVDQWLNFFTNHLGRWLNTYAFENVAREMLGLGEPKQVIIDEATGFINQQMPIVNDTLTGKSFFIGDTLSIADFVAFAYFENAELAKLSLNDYPAIETWYKNIKGRDSIKRAHKKLGR